MQRATFVALHSIIIAALFASRIEHGDRIKMALPLPARKRSRWMKMRGAVIRTRRCGIVIVFLCVCERKTR